MKIPRIQREKYLFISNLKSITATQEFPLTLRRYGYLLSEHYSNDFYIYLASLVRGKHRLLISDNGNFSLMKKVANPFKKKGETLRLKAELELKKNGKVSNETLNLRINLINDIAKHCELALKKRNLNEALANQIKCNPKYIITFEDLTIPVLMICNLLHEVFKPDKKLIYAFQESTAHLFNRQVSGEWGFKRQLQSIGKFAVLHSYDYNTAKQGARILSNNTNCDGIAISYGGAIKSKRFITSIQMDDKTISFEERLPESYMASLAISLGFAAGETNNLPVHVLGIGSPILVAIFGLQFINSKAVSIDSTAPFKDAFQSTIYGSKSALLKMDMYKVAAYTLVENKDFRAKNDFFKGFEKKYPSNWKALRSELGVSSSSNISELAKIIKKEVDLVDKYIPFFARMRGGNNPMIQHLRVARSGHNYYVLRRICLDIRRKRSEPKKLKKWLENEVLRYKKVGSPKWARTVEKMFEITCEFHRI